MSDSKPLALVTGASSGIGLELARQFARHGFDLVINAEDDRLATAAGELGGLGARVETVRADLRDPAGADRVYHAVSDRMVDVAALNAGVGLGGAFVDTDLEDDQSVIDLNVTSTVRLAKPLVRDMVAIGEGRLLFTSSIASTLPGAFQPVYNATKSFIQSFAQALREELKDTGVSVTSFMPGPTGTDFFRRAGMADDTPIGRMEKDDPAQVAAQAYDAVMRGRSKVVTGSAKTRAQGIAGKVLPDRLKAVAHRRMAEPDEPDRQD
ncbi:SDR family NAD(P)-dependent oxidoreductase [Streptomyces sp. NPDC059786]|uniref:SDR family NAD(P)-dependent oxidoreductase n=1 Tax=Streptomyces sp. NPDC059786 TaxID=3346946 RepID=UPI003649831A